MPRYVVLEHRWNGVHWDFMLECAEGLRTWAIASPIASHQELPARALDDHRLIYLDYEGDVSGGRGTVRRVDAGRYRVIEWSADRVHVALSEGQLVGEVELVASSPDSEGAVSWTCRTGNFD